MTPAPAALPRAGHVFRTPRAHYGRSTVVCVGQRGRELDVLCVLRQLGGRHLRGVPPEDVSRTPRVVADGRRVRRVPAPTGPAGRARRRVGGGGRPAAGRRGGCGRPAVTGPQGSGKAKKVPATSL